MSYTTAWDASFEAAPQDTDEARYGASKIRELKLSIRERLFRTGTLPGGTPSTGGEVVSGMGDEPMILLGSEFKNNPLSILYSDSGETPPAGEFRLLVDSDVWKLQGRNAGDTGWEDIIAFQRPAVGMGYSIVGGAPTLVLTDTGETTPAGRFRLLVDGDEYSIQGRNSGDTAFETILTLLRVADGGKIIASSGYTPSADAHLATKKYVDDTAVSQLQWMATPVNKISWTAATTWADCDISSNTGSDTAKAAYLACELNFAGSLYDVKATMTALFRKNGSSETAILPRLRGFAVFHSPVSVSTDCHVGGVIIVECDGSEIFEVQLQTDEGTPQNISFKVDLIGYFI